MQIRDTRSLLRQPRRSARFVPASVLGILLLAPLAEAQQVSRLEISKDPGGSEARTSIDIRISMDIAQLDFNTPIDAERTRLVMAKDDSGTDLLAAHEAIQAEWVAQGYAVESPMSFAGVADHTNERDIKVGINLKAAPAAGARKIKLEGTVALNFIDLSKTASTRLESIPIEMEWGSPGVQTPIGLVRIEQSSSMHHDDVVYQGYQVVSPGAPVIAVKVVGGDASEEARSMGMGLEPGMFFLKGTPQQTVDLDVTYAATKTEEIPFKLAFGVGL
jgi:hypothetical protein